MKKSLLRLASLATSLVLGACTAPKQNFSAEDYKQYLDTIEQRQVEAQIPLDEKAAKIEQRLLSTFYDHETGLLCKHVVAGQRKQLHFEETATMMMYLSWKYGVTKDPATLDLLKRCHDGIDFLDKMTGLDGFVTLSVDRTDSGFQVFDNRTRVAPYSQFLFAASQEAKYVPDQELAKKREEQVGRMAKNLFSNGLWTTDEKGNKVQWADFYPRRLEYNNTRKISTIHFYESVKRLAPTNDPELSKEIAGLGKKLEDLNYSTSIGPLIITFANNTLPTPSSNYFNFLELYNLFQLTGDRTYLEHFNDLEQHYRQNPLANALAFSLNGKREYAINARTWLNTFPITRDSSFLANSSNPLIAPDMVTRYVKFTDYSGRSFPLPVYQRSGDNLEWKRDQYRTDQEKREKDKSYSGVDFLQAYWLLRVSESHKISK